MGVRLSLTCIPGVEGFANLDWHEMELTMKRRRSTTRCWVLVLVAPLFCPSITSAQRRPVALEHQTMTSSFFTGQVAVDAESDVGLVGLNNGTVAVTKRNPFGFWSTGVTLSGTTSNFGIEIALNGGWALISEDQSARLVRTYQYANGVFQPAGVISRPTLAADSKFGYRMDVSADGQIAAISAYDHDDPVFPGDDHGIVNVVARLPSGDWASLQWLNAGVNSTGDARFGDSLAISGDGRRLAIANDFWVHVFERSPLTQLYEQVKRLAAPGLVSGIDISEDGETILVGSRTAYQLRGGGAIFRRNGGVWDTVPVNEIVPDLPFPNRHFLGSTVAISEGIAALGTFNYNAEGTTGIYTPRGAFFAWGDDLDSPSHWEQTSSSPDTTKIGPPSGANRGLEIAMDGQWIFVGMHSISELPQIVVFSIFTPPPPPPARTYPAGDYYGDGAATSACFAGMPERGT